MEAEQQHIFAQRKRVQAPLIGGRFQPRAPDGRAIRPRLLISAIACILPAAGMAGPKDGEVVAGQSTISTPDANTTIIRQSTDKSIINWQSFSVGKQEYVKFVQPQKSSISLNRVVGGNPSSILGSMSANGQVYLVNPNGIYFGQGAQVDVSGIVASVLDIADHDFMSGNYVFQDSADENLGKVINDGIINARNEGYVVLMGDYSENNGVIQAHMGKVVLASGSHVTMDISGNNLISVAVDEAAVSDLAGVRNSGEIYADGGRVIMTAKVARDLVGNAVNNEGLVRAASIVEQDGAIFLTGSGGNVVNSGTLDVSAAAGSNADGGGVLVYSDRDITLSSGAAIHARGDGDGPGGMVRVIAEDVLDHQSGASISVAGAPHAGGFVEVSGHGGLKLRGEVDIGSGGTLLIDPATFRINTGIGGPLGGSETSASVGSVFIEDRLKEGADVYLVADTLITAGPGVTITATAPSSGASAVGDLNVAIGTVVSESGTLGSSYLGTGNCNVDGLCLPGAFGSFGTFGIRPDPDGNINLGNVTFNLAGGLNVAAGTASGSVSLGNVFNAASLNVAAGSAAATASAATPNSVTLGFVNVVGNVKITAGDDVNFQGRVQAAAGGLTATAGNDINVDRAIGGSATSEGIPFNGPVNLSAGNDINVDDNILVANDSVNLAADAGTPDGSGDVNIAGFGSCGEGCFGEGRTVTTAGSIGISGANLNVNGVSFGGFSSSNNEQVPVVVSAGTDLSVNLSGQMIVKGGRLRTRLDADASVKVSAGRDMSIVAPGGLLVEGGFASASTFSANDNSVSANANASLSAGRNVDITVASGNLLVQGGRAEAAASASNGTYFARADAAANAEIRAGGSVTVNSVGGNFSISGGTALAEAFESFSFSPGCSACDAKAGANATIAGGSVTINNVSGTFNVRAGDAGALAEASNADVVATANAELDAGTNLNIAMVSNMVIEAGSAVAAFSSGFGSTYSGSGRVSAVADAIVTSGGDAAISIVNGGLAVLGGGAFALEPNGSVSGTASASAKAELKAGGQATVDVTGGLVAFVGGQANPGNTSASPSFFSDRAVARASGSSGVTPLRKAFANASVQAGLLQVKATQDIFGFSASIDAGGAYIEAGNDLHLFNTTTTVGNGAAPGVVGDPLVLEILEAAEIPLPANNAPNLKFKAGGTMITGDIEVSASNAYLWFETDILSVDNISAPPGPLTVQYSPFTPTLDIVFEHEPPPESESPPLDSPQRARSIQGRPEQVSYFNSLHVGSLPMTTLVLGSALQSGPMTVGANGTIDIGARNILMLTTPDNVNSPDNIITTGLVATSGFVGLLGREPDVFITPRLDSFEVETSTLWDEEEERKKQLVETPEEEHGMCTAL